MFSILNLLVFLIPFCLASASSAEPYSLFSIVFLLFLAVFSVFWILSRGFPVEKLRPIKTPFILTLLFFGIAIICSWRQLVDPKDIHRYFTGFILFAIAISLSPKEKNHLVYGILGAAICVSFMAIYQYFFGFQFLQSYANERNIQDLFVLEKIAERRVFSPFPSPGILAGYLSMVLPLLLSLKRGKLLLLLPIALALLLTRSLGALLSLTLVSMILLITNNPSPKKKFWVPLILGAIVVGIFFMRTYAHPTHLLPIFSMERRLNYWSGTWDLIRAQPWFGTRLGSFDLPGNSTYAHNMVLQLWAEAGIGSVIAFFWMVVAILRKGWRNLQGSLEKNQQLGLFAGVCVFLVYNMTDITFFLPATSFLGWLMMGLLFSTTSEETPKSGVNISHP
ncbi:MAG: O-antigen ligase family protein [Candidatus Omnitrophota bacterium]